MSPPPPQRNGVQPRPHSPHESFAKFFEWWLSQQERDLQDLQAAAATAAASAPPPPSELDEQARFAPLLSRVMSHYESYYRAKSASASRDVLPMFSPDWTSSTENLFHWVGGWRPSMAFHLLYSKTGIQLESNISDLIQGLRCGDLSDLSHDQLSAIDQLQRKTILLEKERSEEEAAVHETLASAQMVELAAAQAPEVPEEEAMEREMKEKREGMEKVLERADNLRLDTLKAVIDVLTPLQAVHFMIAAAELHLRVHQFGKRKAAAAAASAAAAAETGSPSLRIPADFQRTNWI